mmetsp:Transcript_77512/g.216631  ORF Transcript_77512/g.216631 Transcript_77512/m.216631 type:complete len:325 (+) Transcript_77512:357-1331(+)
MSGGLRRVRLRRRRLRLVRHGGLHVRHRRAGQRRLHPHNRVQVRRRRRRQHCGGPDPRPRVQLLVVAVPPAAPAPALAAPRPDHDDHLHHDQAARHDAASPPRAHAQAHAGAHGGDAGAHDHHAAGADPPAAGPAGGVPDLRRPPRHHLRRLPRELLQRGRVLGREERHGVDAGPLRAHRRDERALRHEGDRHRRALPEEQGRQGQHPSRLRPQRHLERGPHHPRLPGPVGQPGPASAGGHRQLWPDPAERSRRQGHARGARDPAAVHHRADQPLERARRGRLHQRADRHVQAAQPGRPLRELQRQRCGRHPSPDPQPHRHQRR